MRGDGLARFNPPDSLRIDLFTSGDVAMAVASAGGRLTSLGEIEDLELPPRPFMFAMAGLFRRVETRRGGRVLRFVAVEWPETGAWPAGAEFRDLERPSRVRWTIESVRAPVARHASEIYALPHQP